MTDLDDEAVVKAAGNLARVHEFFSARRGYRVPPAGIAALRGTRTALDALLDQGLGPVLERNGLTPPAVPPAGSAALPPGELEAERVERAAAYLRQLNEWFTSCGECAASSRGREALSGMAASLLGATAAVEEILTASGVEPAPCAGGPAVVAGPAPAEARPLRGASQPVEAEVVEQPRRRAEDGPLLVFEDTERTPVLQTFQGKTELTYEVTQAIQAFLAGAGIEYNSYQLFKFQGKVLQWVQATPPGSVLVIKVRDLQGRVEPVPSYTRKEARPPARP